MTFHDLFFSITTNSPQHRHRSTAAPRSQVVSQPGNGSPELGVAQESGERLFNQAASCESPVWLPSAFQTVSAFAQRLGMGMK